MLLRPVWFDDFLPEEAFLYWSNWIPSAHEEQMKQCGPERKDYNLRRLCESKVMLLFPHSVFIRQVNWPVMNQLPPGQAKSLHTDPGIISCVYHTSPEWLDGSGALVIMDEEESISISYRPNRLVIFDASIPHMVEAPHRVRYTALVPFKEMK